MDINIKSLLALPGVFLPYNETIAILSYKHLRTLDYDIDVLAMNTDNDESILENLLYDQMFRKFNIFYTGAYNVAIISRENLNLVKLIFNLLKYIKKSVKMSEQKNYSVVYSSSLPNFSHLAGYKVKKRNPRIKWIASFSDPIKDTPFQKYYSKSYKQIVKKLTYIYLKTINENSIYQKVAFKYADTLIFVSEEQRDFMTKGKKELIEKSIIVPFTYIKEWPVYKKLIDGQNASTNITKRIIHLGNVYGLRRIDCLVEGIKIAKNKLPDLHKHIRIEHYGIMEQKQRDIIHASGVGDVFLDFERISYAHTLQIMNEADVLLMLDVFVDEKELQPYMPSKFIEYYLTNKLIFSIANEKSPISRQIKNTRHLSVKPIPDQIADALISIIQMPCDVKNDYEMFENEYVIKNTLKKVL